MREEQVLVAHQPGYEHKPCLVVGNRPLYSAWLARVGRAGTGVPAASL